MAEQLPGGSEPGPVPRQGGPAGEPGPRQQQGPGLPDLVMLRRDSLIEPDSQAFDAILESAHALIHSVGYHELTVGEVFRRAGVSKATFYFYFRNKKHLLIHMASSVMEDLYELAGRHYPEKDEFSRVVLANVAYLSVWQRESRILGTFFALSLVDKQIQEIYAAFRARFEQRISSRIERLASQGRIPRTNPDLLAASLSSMVEFSAFRFFATEEDAIHRNATFGNLAKTLSESWYRSVYGGLPPGGYDYTQHESQEAHDGLS